MGGDFQLGEPLFPYGSVASAELSVRSESCTNVSATVMCSDEVEVRRTRYSLRSHAEQRLNEKVDEANLTGSLNLFIGVGNNRDWEPKLSFQQRLRRPLLQ